MKQTSRRRRCWKANLDEKLLFWCLALRPSGGHFRDMLLDYFCKFRDEKFGRIVQGENLMNKCPFGSVHASFTPHEMRVACMPRRRMMKAGVDGRET